MSLEDTTLAQARAVASLRNVDTLLLRARDAAEQLLRSVRQYQQSSSKIVHNLNAWTLLFDSMVQPPHPRRPVDAGSLAHTHSGSLSTLHGHGSHQTTQPSSAGTSPAFGPTPVSANANMLPPPLDQHHHLHSYQQQHSSSSTTAVDSSLSSTPRMPSPPATTPLIKRSIGDMLDDSIFSSATPSMPSPPRQSLVTPEGATPRMPSPPRTVSFMNKKRRISDASVQSSSSSIGSTPRMNSPPKTVVTAGRHLESKVAPVPMPIPISALRPVPASTKSASAQHHAGSSFAMDTSLSFDASMDNSLDMSLGASAHTLAHGGDTSFSLPPIANVHDEEATEEVTTTLSSAQPQPPSQPSFDLSLFPKKLHTELAEVYSKFFTRVSEDDNSLVALRLEQLAAMLPGYRPDRIELLIDQLVSKKFLRPVYVNGQFHWRRMEDSERAQQ